jgi:hypothetical protein
MSKSKIEEYQEKIKKIKLLREDIEKFVKQFSLACEEANMALPYSDYHNLKDADDFLNRRLNEARLSLAKLRGE